MTSHLTSGGEAYSTVPEQGCREPVAPGKVSDQRDTGAWALLGSERVEMMAPGRQDNTRRGLICSGS